MTVFLSLLVNLGWFGGGYALADWANRRRARRHAPYRWQCPSCTVRVAGSDPVQVAEFTERHALVHRDVP